MSYLLDDISRVLRRRARQRGPLCIVCRRHIIEGETSMVFRGAYVHGRCATYRMRNSLTGRARSRRRT